ncbi:hypothetical protein D3C83_327110 [compost metagenome]
MFAAWRCSCIMLLASRVRVRPGIQAGKLDNTLEQATAKGRVVVSMKADWKIDVFDK